MDCRKQCRNAGLRAAVTAITLGLLVLILIGADGLHAQELSSQNTDSTTYQSSTLYLPVCGSTPETGLMLGGVMVPRFRIADAGHAAGSNQSSVA